MRRLALTSFVVASFALAQPLPAFAQNAAAVTQLRSSLDSARLSGIVDWLKADVERGRIPGAVILIARDGKSIAEIERTVLTE